MYPLLKSIILDLRFNIDVFNNRDHFQYYKEAIHGDFIWSVDRKVKIKGYRIIYITVNTPPGLKSIQINKAAYYPTFIYNIVSLNRLKKRGYWWDTHPNNEYIKSHNGRLIAEVPRIYKQYILKYIPLKNIPGNINTSFQTHYH